MMMTRGETPLAFRELQLPRRRMNRQIDACSRDTFDQAVTHDSIV